MVSEKFCSTWLKLHTFCGVSATFGLTIDFPVEAGIITKFTDTCKSRKQLGLPQIHVDLIRPQYE